MKIVKKMIASMELHLDAFIDNLAMNVQLDKKTNVENVNEQEQIERSEQKLREWKQRLYIHRWLLNHRSISIMQMHLRLEAWMR